MSMRSPIELGYLGAVPPPDPQAVAAQVRDWGHELGFQSVGFAKADLADPEGRLRAWLAAGYAGEMGYMANDPERREDPRRLVEGAKTVVALAMSYRRPSPEPEGPLKVSRYAMSDDYHTVIRKRARRLRGRMLAAWPGHIIKPTVDTSPVLERAWAARAGIAWVGKSTMAISPQLGTYTFLATLITTLEIATDAPLPDRCGSCTRCLDACPTDAFVGPRQLDATRCITYWNVEDRSPELPPQVDLHGWLAGCDVCQQVCPWNKFGVETEEPRFAPRADLAAPDPALVLDEGRDEALQATLKGTPLQRTGSAAIRRNARQILK